MCRGRGAAGSAGTGAGALVAGRRGAPPLQQLGQQAGGNVLSKQQMDALLQIPELRTWYELRRYPLDDVVRYFDKFFVTPASRYIDLNVSTLCDSGCGVDYP